MGINNYNRYEKLECKLYVLGGSKEGESIVFILLGDGKILYSCAVDSFLYKQQAAIVSIMDQERIKELSDVFWTHPHDDHSKGLLDIIDKFQPKNVYIPENLIDLPEGKPKVSCEVLEVINYYSGWDRRKKGYHPAIKAVSSNKVIISRNFLLKDFEVPFYIFALAPSSCGIRRDVIKNDYHALNDYSIALMVVVGDFSIFLTGDIQDRMVEYVKEEIVSEVYCPNILKIPHHGSKDSLALLSLYDEGVCDISVTTAKRTSDLPCEEALVEYKKYSKLLYKIDSGNSNMAMWGVSVDIGNATITKLCHDNYVEYCG